MARKTNYYFRETVTGLRRNGLVAFAAISTAFIALLLLGLALLIREQVNLIVGATTGRVEVVVYLNDEISDAQQQRLNQVLLDMPEVETIDFQSKEEAFEYAKELFKGQPELIENVSPDTFPASFRIRLQDPEQYKVIPARLAGEPGIKKISAQQELLDRLFAVTRVFRVGVLLIAVVMLVSAAVLIANTVRMGLFARRKEIGIMKLVGATNWRIRVPFLVEGMVEGLIGAGLAVIALFGLKVAFIDPLYGKIIFVPWVQSSHVLATVPWILGAGVAVAVLASFVAMRRFLDV